MQSNRTFALFVLAGSVLLSPPAYAMVSEGTGGQATPAKTPPAKGEAQAEPKAAGGSSMLKRRSAKSKDAAKPEEKHADASPGAHGAGGDGHDAQHDAKHEVGGHADAKDASAMSAADAQASVAAPNAEQALAMLREGNARWVKGETQSPNADATAREEAAKGQKPFVSVLGCADSRVPLERLFDRGVGEVFAVRVAGNVAGDSEIGTLEYGIGHLNTPLLVVMGHSKCGAVAAAASGAQVHGKIAGLLAHVQPAVDRAKANNPNATQDELVAAAVRENVWQSIADLVRESSTVRDGVESGKLTVVGAVYDIASGEVVFLGQHPWQKEVIAAGKLHAQTGEQAVAKHDAHALTPQAPAAAATLATLDHEAAAKAAEMVEQSDAGHGTDAAHDKKDH